MRFAFVGSPAVSREVQPGLPLYDNVENPVKPQEDGENIHCIFSSWGCRGHVPDLQEDFQLFRSDCYHM